MSLDVTPVVVERKVLSGLEVIRDSCIVDMFNYKRVTEQAKELNLTDTYIWLSNNKDQYAKGLFCGFISDPIVPKEKLN